MIHSGCCKFLKQIDRALWPTVHNLYCKIVHGEIFCRWYFAKEKWGRHTKFPNRFRGFVILVLMRRFHDAKIEREHLACWAIVLGYLNRKQIHIALAFAVIQPTAGLGIDRGCR